MTGHEKLVQLVDTEKKLLDCVTALSNIERAIIKEENEPVSPFDSGSRLFKLSPGDIAQLEEGYTITVIGNGVAIRLQMTEGSYV